MRIFSHWQNNPVTQRFTRRFLPCLCLVLLFATGVLGSVGMPQAIAQIPLETLSTSFPNLFTEITSSEGVSATWVRLDGRPIFRIAANKAEIHQRRQEIERNFQKVRREYLTQANPEVKIEIKTDQSLPILWVNQHYLLTVTPLDSQTQYTDPESYAQTLEALIPEALDYARQERQPAYLQEQLWKAFALIGATVAMVWFVSFLPIRLAQSRPISPSIPDTTTPITTQLTDQRRKNLKAVQKLIRNFSQALVCGIGGLLILALFPYTRPIQAWITTQLRIYFVISLIGLITYVSIRLSYILIDRLIETFITSTELIPRRAQRIHQRVTTISGVTKGITTGILGLVGGFIILMQLGVNIAPLIAGAGLVGVAISLASQNLIKDAINGFFILMEDQYAVGDVIGVGNVFGLVENITLRITQLRDSEERLITIPNSEVRIVSNLSSHHSQADIKIPVAYSADLDQALAIIQQVGWELRNDPDWQTRILSDPVILGLDEFSAQGMILRIWIRTQPLQQWNVAREYRARLKRELDRAGIPLMLSQYQVSTPEEVKTAHLNVQNHS